MDRSDEYINMSAKIPLIDFWGEEHYDDERVGDYVASYRYGLTETMKSDVHKYIVTDSDLDYNPMYKDEFKKMVIVKLPRQDQCQDKLMKKYSCDAIQLERLFGLFLIHKSREDKEWRKLHDSYEKLWLSYAIYILYNREWNGNEWVMCKNERGNLKSFRITENQS
jgi:hypothetical protein